MEVATGKFPYQSKWASVFEQLYQVVQGDAPRLTRHYNGMDFSEDFCSFVNTWWVAEATEDGRFDKNFEHFSLIKSETDRPKYKTLLQHSFIQLHEKLQPYVHPEVASYVGKLNWIQGFGAFVFSRVLHTKKLFVQFFFLCWSSQPKTPGFWSLHFKTLTWRAPKTPKPCLKLPQIFNFSLSQSIFWNQWQTMELRNSQPTSPPFGRRRRFQY